MSFFAGKLPNETINLIELKNKFWLPLKKVKLMKKVLFQSKTINGKTPTSCESKIYCFGILISKKVHLRKKEVVE